MVFVAIGKGPVFGQLTKAERDYAIEYLKKTKEKLPQTVKGLSEWQLNFKPDDSTWSMAQCIEHIALSETFVFGFAETALKTEANAQMKDEVKFSDDEVCGIYQGPLPQSANRQATTTSKLLRFGERFAKGI